MLVDMVYPYVTKTLQGMLTQWTSSVDFLVWQAVLVIFLIFVIASLILYLVCKGNLIQWFGWVLAVVSVVFCLHTGIYGLNYYADPITRDLRIEQTDYILSDLVQATTYYRDKAGETAVQLPRDEKGVAIFSDFDKLAQQTGSGFRNLMLNKSLSIYGGDYTPVKKLTWYKGVDGITVPLTGESAVNPELPGIALPFHMAGQIARRLCIARNEEADFSAILSCQANDSIEYQYSGYFMAYRYCYNALSRTDPAAAKEINDGCVKELTWDLNQYNQYANDTKKATAARLADQANDAYRSVGGDKTKSNSTVCDLLVNWYLSEHTQKTEEVKFDPYDKSQVDLTGLLRVEAAS